MKRCPKCNVEYFDEILEFCLEDGAKLLQVSGYGKAPLTDTKSNKPNPTTAETVNLPFSNIPETIEVKGSNQNIKAQTAARLDTVSASPLKEKVTSQGYKVLEVAPIVISLAHNWWQWVYLKNQPYYSLAVYIASANFLMWLLLLAAGTAVGLLALKFCQNKGFAYTSLVIIAINLILFLVPNQ